MAETLQFTVSLRDQLSPSLKRVNSELDKTTAATTKAASASQGKNFEFDKAADKVGKLERASKSGERTVKALNTTSGKTVSTMNSVGSSSSSAARKIAEHGTATAKASSGWGRFRSAAQNAASKTATAVSTTASKFNSSLAPIGSKAKVAFGKVDGAARSGLNKAKTTLKKFSDEAKEQGTKSGSKFKDGFKKTVGLLGAGLTIGAAFTFGKDAVVEAGNAEQALGAIDAVFKTSSKSVRDFAMTADQSVGLSVNQFGELATVLGAQLKNGGTAMDQLGSKTTDLVKTGADMSAMFGGTAADAVGAISSALRGERDPIEKYGVSLTQAAVDAKAAELGFAKVGGTLGAEASQAATTALIMEQTADAHGRFADEAGTVMNEQQKLTAGWANMKTEIGDRLIPYVSSLFGWLSDNLPGALNTFLGGLDATIAGMKAFGGWVQDNQSWLTPLAYGLAGVAVAYGVYRGALVAGTVATRIAAAAQTAWNASLLANPITWIVIAIGALVGALVWFFTQTELGQKIWENAWGAIKTAASAVVTWFRDSVLPTITAVWNGIAAGAVWLWQNGIQPVWTGIQTAVGAVVAWFQMSVLPALQAVWNGIVAGAQFMWNNVLKPIWSVMQIAFLVVVTAIMAAWEFILKPVFSAIAAGALWLWQSGIKPAWDGIKAGWNFLVNAIKVYWELVLKPVFNAVAAGAKWLWENGVKPAFAGFKLGWQLLVAGIKLVWQTVLKPVWNAVVAGAKWLWYNGVKPVVNAFKAGWAALGNGIKWVKDNVISPALQGVKRAGSIMWSGLSPIFDAVKRGIKAVGEGFKVAKGVIKTAWDGIKSAAKGPAEFVVNTVYNKGIRKIWNKAAGIFGMEDKKLPEIKMATGGHARARGRVRGAGTGTSDSIDAKLSNGEFVVNAAATQKHLPLLHAINGPGGVGAKEFAQRHGSGTPAVAGGVPAFASGGTLMDAANWWVGKGATGSRHPAFGGAVRSGHSRGSLHYQDKAVDFNFAAGTSSYEQGMFDKYVGAFKRKFPGIRTIWRAPGHYNHLHIDTANGADIGDFSGASNGAGGGSIFDISPLTKLIKSITGHKHNSGDFGKGVLHAGKSLVNGALDKINPLNVMDNVGAGVGKVVESVGHLANKAQVKAVAAKYGWATGDQWKAIDWLVNKESSWNTGAANPSSSARGLFQKMTSIHGPVEKTAAGQAAWGLKYIKDRYNTPTGAMAHHRRKNWYSDGGQVASQTLGAGNVGVFDNGGMWAPGTLGLNAGDSSEMVLTSEQSQIITNGLRAMAGSSSRGGGGDTLTVDNIDIRIEGNVYGVDDLDEYLSQAVEKLMVEIEREWEERR